MCGNGDNSDWMSKCITGNEVEMPVFLIYRIEDGMIAEHWMQADVMGVDTAAWHAALTRVDRIVFAGGGDQQPAASLCSGFKSPPNDYLERGCPVSSLFSTLSWAALRHSRSREIGASHG
jgi:hypothetical protein